MPLFSAKAESPRVTRAREKTPHYQFINERAINLWRLFHRSIHRQLAGKTLSKASPAQRKSIKTVSSMIEVGMIKRSAIPGLQLNSECTNLNVLTTASTRDTELTSTDEDKPGRHLRCRTCATGAHNHNTKGRLYWATHHRVDSGYGVRMGQRPSYHLFHDPRQTHYVRKGT